MMRASWIVLAGLVACGSREPADVDVAPEPIETGRAPVPRPASPTESVVDTGIVPTGIVTVVTGSPRAVDEVRLAVANADGQNLVTFATRQSRIDLPGVPRGGSITQVLETASGARRWFTIADVHEGDVLTFPGDAAAAAPTGRYTLELGSEPADPISFVEIETTCESLWALGLPFAAEVDLDETCLAGSTVDAIAFAFSLLFEPVAFAFVVGAPLDGTVPTLSGTVELGPWTSSFGRVAAEYRHTGSAADVRVQTALRRSGVSMPRGLVFAQRLENGRSIVVVA
ncbi:MAG: hypothetical protein AAF211_29895, partial [Myxococcota bacterium]